MIDGIIKADGTSRLLRATLPATYEEFKAQAASGALPIDVLFNEAGWSQIPTFLNKANLLKDATAALFGLGADAVPDEVLALVPGLIAGRAQIATGSYTGTGTYGASNPCVLQLGFSPKLLFLGTSRYGMFDAVRFLDDIGAEYTAGGVIPASFSFDAITNSGNSTTFNSGLGYTKIENGVLSWYASSTRDPIGEGYYSSNLPQKQFNHGGTTYYYFAIG